MEKQTIDRFNDIRKWTGGSGLDADPQGSALLTLGNEAMKNPDWADYANFCFAREKGLRKEAFKHLDNFLNNIVNRQFEERKKFLNFVLPIFESVRDADYAGCPHPLNERLVKPTLEEWCSAESENPAPFRWYGTKYYNEEYLLKALEIDPADDLARVQIIERRLYGLYFPTHHMPDGYIGSEPESDLLSGEQTLEEIKLLRDPKKREYLTRDVEWYMDLIRNYIDWRKSGHPNLAEWGKETGRNVDSGIITVYYTE